MEYIPLGDQNPLLNADGQARAMNAVLEQLCLLRAEIGAVQGTLMLAASHLNIEGEELVKLRIEVRDQFYQRIRNDIMALVRTPSPPSA